MDGEHGLSGIDLGIIAAYFIVALVLGVLLAGRAARSVHAYFLGGRRIPWWVIGMSGTASNFDMTGTMVIISFIYAIGLQGFWVAMRGGMCLPLGILLAYMGKWLRRSEVMTTAEWMTIRFGTGREGTVARTLSAVANIVVTLAFLVYFVKGTGKFLAVFLPFSPETCSLIMIVVATGYTALSGFYGVIYTDVLQECLILVSSVFVGYKALTLPEHAEALDFGGADWVHFTPHWTAEPMAWLANPDIYHMFGLCIAFWIARGLFEGAGGLSGGYMPQRYYAARNEREAGLLTVEWVVLLMFRWMLIIGTAILGLSIARASPEVAAMLGDDPEKTLPVVLVRAIPAGLRGLLVAGLIAAAMSTFDSTINAGVSYWVRDIYQVFVRPNGDRRSAMVQSYAATVVFAAVAVGLGLAVENINEIWSWITGPLSAGIFVPLILRWYWWRLNGYGFALSTAVGLLASVGLKIIAPDMPFYSAFVCALVASFLAAVIGSYATSPTAIETLDSFWRRIHPFGLWRPVVARQEESLVGAVRRETLINVTSAVTAVGWQVAGVVAVISLMLREWRVLSLATAVFVVLGTVLALCWYRNLPPARKLGPSDS